MNLIVSSARRLDQFVWSKIDRATFDSFEFDQQSKSDSNEKEREESVASSIASLSSYISNSHNEFDQSC